MKAQELKNIVSQRIMEIQDISLLQKINTMIDYPYKEQLSLFSEEQIAWLREASNEFKAAYTQTNDEIAREIEEWLSEKILI